MSPCNLDRNLRLPQIGGHRDYRRRSSIVARRIPWFVADNGTFHRLRRAHSRAVCGRNLGSSNLRAQIENLTPISKNLKMLNFW